MKERNYDALVAGMRTLSTITDAEEVMRTQPKLKLPDRRSITLWNSPGLGQFRGVNESFEKKEEAQHIAQTQHLDAKRVARTEGVPMPDIQFVQQAQSSHERRETPMQQHRDDMDELNAQQQRGMAEDNKAAIDKLLVHTAEHANRTRVVEEVAAGFRDTVGAHMDYMRGQAAAVAPQTFIDSRVTNHNTYTTAPMEERSAHNQRMDFIDANLQGLGAAVAGQQQTNAQLNVAIDRMFKEKVQDPVTVISGSGGPGPDPGSGGGAVSVGRLQPLPVWPHLGPSGSVIAGGASQPPGPPAPMLPSAVPPIQIHPEAAQYFAMDTPRNPTPEQLDKLHHSHTGAGVKKTMKGANAKRLLVPTSNIPKEGGAAMETEVQTAPPPPSDDPAAPPITRGNAAETRARNTVAAAAKRKLIAEKRENTRAADKAKVGELKKEAEEAMKIVKADAKAAKQEEKRIAAEKRKTQPPGSTNKGAPQKTRPTMDETPPGFEKRATSSPPKADDPEEIPYPKAKKAKPRAKSADENPDIKVPVAKAATRGRSREAPETPQMPKPAAKKPVSRSRSAGIPVPKDPVEMLGLKDSTRSIGPDTQDVETPIQKASKSSKSPLTAAQIAAKMSPGTMPTVAGPRNKTKATQPRAIPSAAPQGNRKLKVYDLDLTPKIMEAGGTMTHVLKRNKPKKKPALLATVDGLRA